MGYRSDIKAIIKFTDRVQYGVFLSNLKFATFTIPVGEHFMNEGETENLWEGLAGSDGHGFSHDDEKLEIKLLQRDVKWYEGYADVDAAMLWFRKSELAGAAWRLVRIGEELVDIEEQSGGNEDIDLYDAIVVLRSLEWG